ncbi:hypothetical protein SKAU_G00149100 [Synaphobranchus kaupii]|uniref:Uncharacterized protein n=1 Tax=Synaphobranchus kaupii TaxID=118154 RepID=A0A9Q1J413_SYNKA|nr:hypothetical protein SKAU_G00149100 [Synaphobranchus kaupii]
MDMPEQMIQRAEPATVGMDVAFLPFPVFPAAAVVYPKKPHPVLGRALDPVALIYVESLVKAQHLFRK